MLKGALFNDRWQDGIYDSTIDGDVLIVGPGEQFSLNGFLDLVSGQCSESICMQLYIECYNALIEHSGLEREKVDNAGYYILGILVF